MKINTLLGKAEILDASMVRAFGYGQYKIAITVKFEGTVRTFKCHSTDSELFDKLSDFDNDTERSKYLMRKHKYLIQREAINYIESL